jgi:hypothetical protein
VTDETRTPPEAIDPWCTCGYRESAHPDGACPTTMSRFTYSTFHNDLTVSAQQIRDWKNEKRRR